MMAVMTDLSARQARLGLSWLDLTYRLSLILKNFYLLTYENAIPVVVSLIPGQDGAVMASAVAVLNKNFKSSSAEDIENFLSGFNAHECTVGRTE